MNNLFDKQVKLFLYDSEGGVGLPTDTILIPETGIKPNVTINAEFLASNVVQNPAIRIMNFYPSKSLSSYKWFKVLAGYRDSPDWSGFEGKIWVAYQESPSPDGVTLFSCEVANTTDIYNALINIHVDEGESLSQVLRFVVDALAKNNGNDWTLENSLPDIRIQSRLDYNGQTKDLMATLKQIYGFDYGYEGHVMYVCNANEGRTAVDTIDINYLSGPPSQSASGVTFTAPWIPKLRPFMKIHLDPKYFKQSFGAANVNLSSELVCFSINLQFNTVTNQNTMTVLALNTAEIATTGAA